MYGPPQPCLLDPFLRPPEFHLDLRLRSSYPTCDLCQYKSLHCNGCFQIISGELGLNGFLLIVGCIIELIPTGGNGACLSFCDDTCRGTAYRRLFMLQANVVKINLRRMPSQCYNIRHEYRHSTQLNDL